MSEAGPTRGEARPFEELFAPILGVAYAAALHLTRSRDEAEDLVQDAALKAFRAFGSFQTGTNFKAWFLKIQMNEFLQRIRKKKTRPEGMAIDVPDLFLFEQTRASGIQQRLEDPAESLMRRISAERVSEAIASLPEEFRVVCVLHFLQESSYQEIAEALECPIGTVRSRLHRGRRMLQKKLWDIAVEDGIVAELRSGESEKR